MTKTWINLHNHTVYSMLDGHGQHEAYMQRAANLKMPALSITDHGNVYGWLDFYEAAQEYGVKPILGMEAYQARKTRFDRDEEERAGPANDELSQRGPYHLTVLAKNLVGYKNLMKLSSKAFLEGFYVKPRIDHELLSEHAEGLIVLSGCLNGEVAQSLMREDYDEALRSAGIMQDIVGKENYFIEVMDHGIEEEKQVLPHLQKIAQKIDAPLVATGDCHYVEKSDSMAHDLMLCVATNSKMDDEDRFKFRQEEFHLKSYEEMLERCDPEWLDNTLRVADMIDVDLKFDEFHFPDFPIPEDRTVDDYLEEKVWEGIENRYGKDYGQDVADRVNYELRVVKDSGFQGYFLVVSDLTRWARDNGIRTGWGRGSAAGSILSYALRITNLDPLRFGLLFERFLVEGRKSPPDIDLDFDDNRREEVIQYARDKYGEERVSNIGTFSRVGSKQAIKDAARVLGYDFSTGNDVSKLVPPPKLGVSKTLDESLQTKDMRKAYDSNNDTKTIIDAARGLEGLVRQTGIHAAGVVIAKENILEHLPVMQRSKKNGKGPVVTQWDYRRAEQCGQLKVDFLGLRNLGVIDVCVKKIEESKGFTLDIESIPLDDELTYRKLREGYSMGVFQLESSGMREMMIALQPNSIEDLMALVSLYRPGPLGGGVDKIFIARKHGRDKTKADHPVLDELLESTYGVMLYQEDVLKVARQLAGFDAAQADDLRKAMGKKQMDKIGLFREKFVEGCKQTHGIEEKVANKIYSDIEFFGGYGFNLAHAASYAMVSYVTAYLKFHYSAEYMAALLTSVNNKEKASPYLNECRSMGINVLPPSINDSFSDFSVISEDTILFGLSAIGGIGPAVVDAILRRRTDKYHSLYDFMRRCDTDVLNKGTLEHLLKSGAFDELVPEQESRLLSRDEKMDILEEERSELGLYITEHPLVGVWQNVESHISITIDGLENLTDGESVTIGGMLSEVTPKTTKRGERMYVLTVEDITGTVEVLVFPRNVRDYTFSDGEVAVITGRLSQEGDDEHVISKVFFSEMIKPEVPQFGSGAPIVIDLIEKPDYNIVNTMKELIHKHPGDCPVYINYAEPDGTSISLRFKRPANGKIADELKTVGQTMAHP